MKTLSLPTATLPGLLIGSFNHIADQHCRSDVEKQNLRAQLELAMTQTRSALATQTDGPPMLTSINRQEIAEAARKAIGQVFFNDPNIDLEQPGKKLDAGIKQFLANLGPIQNGHSDQAGLSGAGVPRGARGLDEPHLSER